MKFTVTIVATVHTATYADAVEAVQDRLTVSYWKGDGNVPVIKPTRIDVKLEGES